MVVMAMRAEGSADENPTAVCVARVSEQVAYDRESGQLLSARFMDYAMPRADVMCDITFHENPVPAKTNPLGAKVPARRDASAHCRR